MVCSVDHEVGALIFEPCVQVFVAWGVRNYDLLHDICRISRPDPTCAVVVRISSGLSDTDHTSHNSAHSSHLWDESSSLRKYFIKCIKLYGIAPPSISNSF